VASQIGSVAEAWFGQEPDEIDFMYDLSMADGSIQYVVRAVFGAVSKFLLVRVYGTQQSRDLREDVDEVEVDGWPPKKLKPKVSSFAVRYKPSGN
jgi:hypothetical protein